LRAIVFSSRSSLEVQPRRFFFLFAITPPFQETPLVSPMRAKEKPSVTIILPFGSLASELRPRTASGTDCEKSQNSFWHHKTKSSFRSLPRM
jgi:hypothetical protein